MRKTLLHQNFVGENLAGQDLSNTDFLNCSFSDLKLVETNFSKCNLFGCDFSGSDLYSAIISLNCFTFRDIILDDNQVRLLLYMIQLAKFDPAMRSQIRAVIGARTIEGFERIFQR